MEELDVSGLFSHKSGVYVVTYQVPKNVNEPFLVKIGLAKAKSGEAWEGKARKKTLGLASRLDQYLLYWPVGVIVFGVFVTDVNKADALEAAFHYYATSKGRYLDPQLHSHTGEWFILSLADIYIVMEKVAQDQVRGITSRHIFQPPKMITRNGRLGARQSKLLREVPTSTPARVPAIPSQLPQLPQLPTLPRMSPKSRRETSQYIRGGEDPIRRTLRFDDEEKA